MPMTRQEAALAWAVDTFGDIAKDPHERACRFVEEAIELAQAAGIDRDTLGKIIERVYSRNPGDLRKEVGQAALTIELFAEVLHIDAGRAAQAEYSRVQEIPKSEWDRRHAAKVALGIAS